MARITHLRQKKNDGTMSDWIPIGVDSNNINVSINFGDESAPVLDVMTLQEAIDDKVFCSIEWKYI